MQSETESITTRALKALSKEYVAVGKTRVRSWRAWLIIGLAAGILAGVLFVANRSGEFDYSLAQVAPTSGNVYYVATNGNNSNPGTQSLPWRNIDYAVDHVSAGGTIQVRGGTYNERVTIGVSGTAGNYITLQSYSGEQAKLDGAGLGNGTMLYGINISFFKVIGLEIQNHTGGGIAFRGDGSNIEIRNNLIHDQTFSSSVGHVIIVNATDPVQYGTPQYVAHAITDVIIDGNIIGPNVDTGTPTTYNECLTIAFNVDRVKITNNVLDDCSHIGIDTIGKENWQGGGRANPDSVYISANTIKNSGFLSSSVDNMIYLDGAKNVVVENNLIFNSKRYGIGVSAEDANFKDEQVIVRNNRILRMGNGGANNCNGVGIFTMGVESDSTNVRHAHNSIFLDSAVACSGASYGLQLMSKFSTISCKAWEKINTEWVTTFIPNLTQL